MLKHLHDAAVRVLALRDDQHSQGEEIAAFEGLDAAVHAAAAELKSKPAVKPPANTLSGATSGTTSGPTVTPKKPTAKKPASKKTPAKKSAAKKKA